MNITQDTLILHTESMPFLNISLYLNNIPFIQKLVLENLADIDSSQIDIKISSDIPCFEEFSYSIAYIPAGRDIKIPLNNLKVNRSFLNNLSESEKAKIKIELFESGELVKSEEITLIIHPLAQFGGFQILPELIATYITPNHPYVYHIKRKAIEILEKQGNQTAFEGYQGNSVERVMQMISAIYSAIQNEEIIYSSLPPGYEESGQRLRLLSTIQNEKFGNCIDLSLLFAACLEAVNLNPLVIIVLGHAFVGCWLNDDKFSEIINDDKTAITKRLSKGIREIIAFEATSVCKGNNLSFSDALNIGEARLVEKEDFLISIDIKRARTSRIRPIPLLLDASSIQLDDEALKRAEIADMENHFEIGKIYKDELINEFKPKTKQKIWERKLLDMSLRNNLLNLRMTRNMLQLIDIDISQLEDVLSEGKSFSIVSNPRADILRKYNLFNQPLHQSSPEYQVANDELKYNRLLSYYHQQDLDSILTYIHKNARQSIEENGSSTLYLAVGLLKWFDKKNPDQPRYAPVLLIPVEISRRSVNSKFILKSREEETMINITLIEFLRQEYELNLGALEQLPYDEKGVDVSKVMSTLRRAVMQLKGWDVEEQLILGNFSFSKLILWKDIVVHKEALLKSDMVRSLIEGKLDFSNPIESDKEVNFDNIHSASIALPIAADVSQIEAVHTAQKGQSFILHGPPGTGKSQTITNIIADALYHGKRVLFVAAKKAALDVVQKRLDQIGLGPFSLELHSNKSKKSDVLAQLANSIETARQTGAYDYIQEAQRLDESKKELSNYINVLHEQQLIGWSLYDSIAALENFTIINFKKSCLPEKVLSQLDRELWQRWQDWLPQFHSISQIIEHPQQNPFSSFKISNYSAQIHDTISEQTQILIESINDSKIKTNSTKSSILFPFPINNYNQWVHFGRFVEALKGMPDVPLELCLYLSDKDNKENYLDWKENFKFYQTTLATLESDYNRSIFSAEISTIEMQWKQALQSWFLPKWLKKRSIQKQLAAYRKTPFRNDEEIGNLFMLNNQRLEAHNKLQQQRFIKMQVALKNLYKEEQTDLNDIELKAASVNQLGQIVDNWGTGSFGKLLQMYMDEGKIYFDEIKDGNVKSLTEFIHNSNNLKKLLDKYESLTGISFHDQANNDNWFQIALNHLEKISISLPKLKDWMNYVQIIKGGGELQLQWFISAYENKSFSMDELSEYFHFTIHRSIVQKVISEHESLSLFNVNLFESKITQYKKIAKDFLELTIQEIRVKLSSQLPNTTMEAMQSSEIGILQRAIKNRGRGLSIRRLFDQIPTLLPRLSPCMLMSPISVAQYFDVNTNLFDLVIFDEASQLPTCEAVSALARAKQAIIVGDPKQMPPTSFFSTNKVDEDNMDVEDLESILDDCLALSMPSKYLLKHYRSKHESLIAFSNINYYENKLLTFPSYDDLNRKVQYHNIQGFYDKGKTRTNKFEVAAIINFIKEHYNNPHKSKLSLGVVTFSQTQQSLVEDKVQQLFMENPEIEQISNESSEPLFIKNLENVQGDERDIILFSIGYAPDEQGKLSMNFGPLNRSGGWRRLNVAITRARYEMHVFATLHTDQIDLSRTSAEGVAGLKAFLRFAEKGQLPMRPEDISSQATKKYLPEAISKRLKEKGFHAKCNIGTSGFKIDIGVIHPENPHQYILGILIDGKYYYGAKTANDREVVMPSVLNSLGWNIYRIWTMDWLENADRIIDGIVQRIEELISQPTLVLPLKSVNNSAPVISNYKSIPEKNLQEKVKNKQIPYIPSALIPVYGGNSESIYEFQNRNIIKVQMQAVINSEAPVSKTTLYKKVLLAWNTTRAGAKLDRHLEGIINELEIKQSMHHQPFYWNNSTSIDFYRINDIEKRSIEDIAPEEIIVALMEVILNNLSIEEEELLRYLARTFNFAKVGSQIDMTLRYAIDLAVRQGSVKREGGRIRMI